LAREKRGEAFPGLHADARSGRETGMTPEDRPYISCRELLDFLHLYLEDELPADRRHEFDRHLAVCPPCVTYIREYRNAVRLGRQAYADAQAPPPPDAPEELIRAVLKARSRD
jgi:anti-sigma factor RsiW